MRRNSRRVICLLPGLLVGLALGADRCAADTVWLQSGKGNPIALSNVKVTGVEGGSLTFTTSVGRDTSRKLDQIPRIRLDDEPAFSSAEDAYAGGDYAAAAAAYQKALSASGKDWVRQRSAMRLVDAANHAGDFAAACGGFVACLQVSPAVATQNKPAIPQNHTDQIDAGIQQIKLAAQDRKLGAEQKAVLLNYLVEMYGAKGDTASANAVLQQLNQAPAPQNGGVDNRRVEADLKLTAARQLYAQHQYDGAVQTLDAASGLFIDPQQQAEALFLLAQSREATAASDANRLKDAALAYIRVVVNCKGIEGQPHVAESLLRVGTIEEKLKNTKEAIAIYQQVAAEFKGTPAAAEAQQQADRLAAAKT